MVKHELDAAAAALSSAPRRAVIERLATGPASMSELAEHVALTLPAVDKHLGVLLDAGVVSKTKHGRTTQVHLVPGSLEPLATWAMSQRLFWAGTLDRLGSHLGKEQQA